ncbi:MAG: FAD-dependent oxidoreductase [Bacteroidota bacterium]
MNKFSKIILYGHPNSSRAYQLRDFLKRSVIDFDWIELTDVCGFLEEKKIQSSEEEFSSYIVFPDRQCIVSPSIEDVVKAMGCINEPQHQEYDLSIYGSGPAGLSAAVYAASEGLKTVLVERSAIGGQAGTSSLIENYMGFPEGISGAQLAENARQQALKFGVEILLLREGVRGEFKNNRIYADLASGDKLVAKSNICATGVEYRKLNIEGEDKYLHRGLYYGAGSSEATLCQDEDVYVIGGGNSSGQAAMNFSSYARSVTMVVRGNDLASSLSHYLIKKIEQTDNIQVLFNTELVELSGEKHLEAITLNNKKTQKRTVQPTRKLFICIGGVPNTAWSRDTDIICDKNGYLLTGHDLHQQSNFQQTWTLERPPYSLETSVPGCFAAGDVRFGSVKRVASAVGEGAMAVTIVHKYLKKNF